MEFYKNQVALLLSVIPEVEKEKCFALHGGTAINLFQRDMPRLSVDIDLTYIPIQSREESFDQINLALVRIKKKIEALNLNIRVVLQEENLKLLISNAKAQIKVEVNQGMRGIISPILKKTLCAKAQEDFDAFCTIDVVSLGQLYGGKLCAALDRQHPRDLFDVKYLLDNEGINEEIKSGFIYALLSSKRPINEMLFPHSIDQREAFDHQFQRMTTEPFTYDEFLLTQERMVVAIQQRLSDLDIQFIISFENGTPDWNIYNFEQYPSVQWKLQNLLKLKANNLKKHVEGVQYLQEMLNSIKKK